MRLKTALFLAALVAASPAAAWAETLDAVPFAKKLKLAKVGDEDAQLAVGLAYEKGADTPADPAEAAKWYQKAATQGNLEAQFRLGRLVQEGVPGLKKNPETAAKLYEGAAKQGHVQAENWLGYCYQHGIGVAQSTDNAILWYTKAADAGLAEAQNNLGLVYLNAKNKKRDLAMAFKLFEKAAQQGDDWGLNNLGGMYEMGWGVGQDKQKALDLYQQAMDKGNSRAGENRERLAALIGKAKEPATPAEDTQPDTSVQPAAAEPKSDSSSDTAAPASGVKSDSSN